MVITHKKLQPMLCYHIFSDTRDVYLSKNHYGSYSPQMVPVAEMSGSGSWPITQYFQFHIIHDSLADDRQTNSDMSKCFAHLSPLPLYDP